MRIVAVQGLQFGSEAKGNVAALVAQLWKPDTTATAWGPNAGHTAIVEGNRFVHTMLPVGALAPSVQTVLLGPGSVIDLQRLYNEIAGASMGKNYLEGKDLIIHPQAAVLNEYDALNEQSLVCIGSTMKGTMAAVIRKMGRNVDNQAVARYNSERIFNTLGPVLSKAGMSLAISEKKYDTAVDRSGRILLEGAQGFSLGIHTDFWPYTTSRDVSTAQLFADCRIPFPDSMCNVHVIGVFRTYPIRVANRFRANDNTGENEQIGTSGGFYPDQEEIEWSKIGREAELTTVTKLPRRLFTLSEKQLGAAARIMRPTSYAMTFCDYLIPSDHLGWQHHSPTDIPPEVTAYIPRWMQTPKLLGFGPNTSDIWETTAMDASMRTPFLEYLP